MEKQEAGRLAETGAWIGTAAYLILSIFKLTVGYGGRSEALTADGLNNTTDIIAMLAVIIGLRIARKPADRDHRYGHSRAETIASLVASFIMAAVGIEVLIGAVSKLAGGEVETPGWTAAWVALLCAGVMLAVYRFNLLLARRTNSHALKAAAKDNLSDAWVSLGTVAGIAGAALGLPWLDGVTAVLVGLLICWTAWTIFKEASHMLSDGFDETELEKLKSTVLGTDGVERVKDIKGRIHGNEVLVDLVIEVDKEMSVWDSHLITEKVEQVLQEEHKVKQAHVHIEPH
ncbi:cation diffusion facilitator family transporter [Paenibacillus aurantius]|uniref:Cation diffusion facilitator family transporter n=1 Tax=Paenibacillus aurantius TaxID=2918900 RepID=A0AA96LDL2_9BACL|nr:cation diffusion facilitator family transporter [Paenibacillus aurantius]WNQ11088.1 cation diffusion facilitator family transporter [Paenibacillus aurantius]